MTSNRERARKGDRLEPALDFKGSVPFPKMTFAEILDDFNANNWDCPISKEAFRSPTSDDVQRLLYFFFNELYALRPEDFAQPDFGCLDEHEFPELYDVNIANHNLFLKAQEMFNHAQFHDFGLRDLHAPQKNRFQWMVSALLNFHKFRATRLAMADDRVGNLDELAERERAALENRSMYQTQITAIEEERAKDEEEKEEVTKRVSELSFKLSAHNKKHAELADQIREDRATIAKQAEEHNMLKAKLVEVAENVEQNKSKIISSPDKARSHIENLSESIAASKEIITGLEELTLKKRAGKKSLDECTEKVGQTIDVLNVVLQQQEVYLGVKKEIAKWKAAEQEANEKGAAMRSSQAQIERIMASKQQKLARMKDQGSDFSKHKDEQGRAISEKEAQFQDRRSELEARVEQGRRAIQEIKQTAANRVAEFREEEEAFAQRQTALLKTFTTYRTQVENSMELIIDNQKESLERIRQSSKTLQDVDTNVNSSMKERHMPGSATHRTLM